MRLLALFAVLVILFGCLQPGLPEQNATNQTPAQNQTNQSVTIIIGPQQNQTTGGNTTQPVLPSNQTEPGYANDTNATLGIYFIDVGSAGLHGNAIFVKKGDMEVLVDAGPAQNANKVVDFLNSRAVDDIELLISTNADPRNYGGMSTVADNFRVESFWWNGDSVNDAGYNALVARMAGAPEGARAVERGTSTTLNGVKFEVLNPPNMKFGDINNDAIVLRITDRNFSMLLTSGIQTGAQQKLISEQGDKIKTQVLQAPYYGVGAGTSQIGIFLINAKPSVIIITGSADESAANGGSRDPFRMLMGQYNMSWYENYVSGTLRIITDGSAYTVQLANGTAIAPTRGAAHATGAVPAPGTGAGAGSTGD